MKRISSYVRNVETVGTMMDNVRTEVKLKRCCLDGYREIFKSDVCKNLNT